MDQAFDEACVELLSLRSSGASPDDTLLTVLSIWRIGFTNLEGVTKAGVLHREILFEDVRVSKKKKICVNNL